MSRAKKSNNSQQSQTSQHGQSTGLSPFDSKLIVQPESSYKGLSYGDLVTAWTNWLMGDKPDYYDGADILFLRGNVGYYNDRDSFYDRGDPKTFNHGEGHVIGNGIIIPEDTAILVPIITAQFNLGDQYQGARIEDEVSLRRAVREDLDWGGEMWGTIWKGEDQENHKLVDDLLKFRFETPRFKMTVSENNPFRQEMETPKEPGVYDAITGGYFVLLRPLPGKYVIRFGAKGRGNYYTDAVYEIKLEGRRTRSVKDATDEKTTPDKLYKDVKTVKTGTTPRFIGRN